MNPDPDMDPAIFITDWRQQKTNFIFKSFLLITFWRYIYIDFQRKKVKKKSQNIRNQSFSYYFC